jgi:hypothetical protein
MRHPKNPNLSHIPKPHTSGRIRELAVLAAPVLALILATDPGPLRWALEWAFIVIFLSALGFMAYVMHR